MRIYIFLLLTIALLQTSLAQPRSGKEAVYSTASDWQKVTLVPATPTRSTTRTPSVAGSATGVPVTTNTRRTAAPVSGYRPAFTGDFATNRNGWKAGVKGDYQYQIGMGKYNILKRKATTQKAAFSFVQLPSDINLNLADEFSIKVDVVADSGRVPTGGLVFGVSDSLNYSAFILNGAGDVTIVRVADGQTFGDYMPGDSFKPGVPLEKNRNRLIIRRKGNALRFYINDQEVRSSPYPFRMLSGNGIGVTTTGYWTSFQKLSVTLGP